METRVKGREREHVVITRLRAEKKQLADAIAYQHAEERVISAVKKAKSALWIEKGKVAAMDWVLEAARKEFVNESVIAEEHVNDTQLNWARCSLPWDIEDTVIDYEANDSFDSASFAEGFNRGLVVFWRKIKDHL